LAVILEACLATAHVRVFHVTGGDAVRVLQEANISTGSAQLMTKEPVCRPARHTAIDESWLIG